MYKKFLFIFAALSGLGGLACILQWLEIKPKDLSGWHMPLTLPHLVWLVFSGALFAISITLSVWGLIQETDKKLDSQCAPTPTKKVWDRPKVIVTSIVHNDEGMFPETTFTLHNVSQEHVAQKVCLDGIALHGAKVKFREIPLLGTEEKKELHPEIDNPNDPQQKNDFKTLIHAAWASQTLHVGYTDEYSVPALISYEDLNGNKCQTEFSIYFSPKAHIQKVMAGSHAIRNEQPTLEARYFVFKEANGSAA